MSFGWSAGDIATAISVIVKICKALDDTFGASSEYRDITLFLGNLKCTLDKLYKISENTELECAVQLKEQVDILRPRVEDFLDMIEKKYGLNLGKGSTRRFRAVAGKLEWAAVTSTKAKELRDSIESNMWAIDRLIQFEIYASVQTKIPSQLEAGFSGVQVHVDKSIQPLHADVGHILSIMQEQNPLIAKALMTMQAAIQSQSQSRATSPQPPAYSPIPPPRTVTPPPSLLVATILDRYKMLVSKNSCSGFEFAHGQQEVCSISNVALESLGAWLKSTDPEIGWIKEAPSTRKCLSVAAGLIAAGKYSKVQTIGYSILKGEAWLDDVETPRQIMANIISSLVHQLMEKLPALTKSRNGRERDSPLVKARLSVLGQQNLKAIRASLLILGDLVELITDPFLVILDCFERYHLVKDKMLLDKMQQLVHTFRRNSMVKVFFSAVDRGHVNGVAGDQKFVQSSTKEERRCVLVNPKLVEMLDFMEKPVE